MKTVFFTLALMLVSGIGFASTKVESTLDLKSEKNFELITTDIEDSMSSNENYIIETITVDLGIFGCTSYVTVVDKDTKKVLATFKYYDEECDGDMQSEFWYV